MTTLPVLPPISETRVSLPFPPSVNNLFFNVAGRGRVRTKTYITWLIDAGWALKEQKPAKTLGKVAVSVELCAPDKRRRDADNGLKAVLDLLSMHKIIEADDSRYVNEINVSWVPEGDPCCVKIRGI